MKSRNLFQSKETHGVEPYVLKCMEVYSYNLYIHLGSLEAFELGLIYSSTERLCDKLNLEILNKCSHVFPSPIEVGSMISHSGIFLLSTSHIAWHTFPENGFVHISLSTCKNPIEINQLEKYIKDLYINVLHIEHVPCL